MQRDNRECNTNHCITYTHLVKSVLKSAGQCHRIGAFYIVLVVVVFPLQGCFCNASGPRERSLRQAVPCLEKAAEPRIQQRGDYWVLYNYVVARRRFRCWESITYTTHGHFDYLPNLKPVLELWQGPVSLAMHAPGSDFDYTLKSIRWARKCLSPLVTDLVTFHVFFESVHMPRRRVPPPEHVLSGPPVLCSKPAPWTEVDNWTMYRTRNNVSYPVNVARNIARETARTHYVLSADIELYPSPGVIYAFLEMVRRNDAHMRRPLPKVFPLPVFEITEESSFPKNKTELVTMLKLGNAIPFHANICFICHIIPGYVKWITAKVTKELHVFQIKKRVGYHYHWEPIFIGTNSDPFYDERLTIHGLDKMEQAYTMCVLNYEFHVLDNAYLVHKPGIKKETEKEKKVGPPHMKNVNLIDTCIIRELNVLHGVRRGCIINKRKPR